MNKLEVRRAKENIIVGKEMHRIIGNVFTDLSRMIQCTIGPCAGNTLVTEPFGSVPIFPTKDGFKVMNNHNYDDLYYESIYRIIRDVSGRMNEYLGDGPQPLYAKVLTPNGFVQMGSLKIGDTICGTDGSVQTVIGVFPKGQKEIYQFVFDDGSVVECCEDHTWSVFDNWKNNVRLENITTRGILEKGYCKPTPDGHTCYRYYTPVTIPYFSEKRVSLHPIILGILLGDGCFTKKYAGITIDIGYSKLQSVLNALMYLPMGITYTTTEYKSKHSIRFHLHGKTVDGRSMKDILCELGLFGCNSKTKFIPDVYKYNSYENRCALLTGLTITDGHIDSRGLLEYSTVSERLFNDVCELMKSLGKSLYTTVREPRIKYFQGKPFQASRLYHICELKGYKYGRKLVNIIRTGRFTEMMCIKVSNPDELYITDNYIVTHNTTSSVVIASDIYKRLDKYLLRHRNITPYGAKKILDVALEHLEKLLMDPEGLYRVDLNKLSREDRLAMYKNVATISANNDSDIAEKVVQAYKNSNSDYAYIDVQESTNEKDIIETNLGFEITTGYILRHMANMPDGVTAEYENPFFLLIDGPILRNDTGEIEKFIKWSCVELQRPLVIFASEFCKDVCDLFVRCNTGYPLTDRNGKTQLFKLPVIGVMLNTGNEYGVSRIQDLEACLGAHCLQTNTGALQNCPNTVEEFMLLVGRADSIKSVPHYTRIRGGAGSRAIREGRIKEIENLIKQNKDAAQHGMNEMVRLETLKKRAGMLQGEMHCIRVGGDSYKEKQNRKMIFDDAIQAVKACINNGITLGGNVSIAHCITNHRDELIENIYNTVTDPSNTYNVMVNTSPSKMKKCIGQILDIIAEGSKAGFKAVFNNASNSVFWKNGIFKQLYSDIVPKTYDIIKSKFVDLGDIRSGTPALDDRGEEKFDYPTLVVPGNTDVELLKSAFCIVGMFISSNQILSVHVVKENKV